LVATVALLRFTELTADFRAVAPAAAFARLVVPAGLAARAVLAELPVLDPLDLLVDLPVDLPARAVERAVRVGFGSLASPRLGM